MLSLQNLREQLGRPWLIVLFGVAYVVSQATIISIVKPIEREMALLQVTAFSASDYIATFEAWESTGQMAAYHAHFILDDVHWIWYSMLFITLLAWLFQRHGIAQKFNWVLLLPLASGLFDWYENHLQHVFLSAPDYAAIIDPLPMFSTIASILKWLLALTYVLLSLFLIVRLVFKK